MPGKPRHADVESGSVVVAVEVEPQPVTGWLAKKRYAAPALGVHMLLFTIGLKLKLGSLLCPQVWAAALFGSVDLKPDLGPLIPGVLVGSHAKADEWARTLLRFKNLFLTGFFLSIGMSTDLTLQSVSAGLLLLVMVPFKVAAIAQHPDQVTALKEAGAYYAAFNYFAEAGAGSAHHVLGSPDFIKWASPPP